MHDLKNKIAAVALSVGGVFAAHTCTKEKESPLTRETLTAHNDTIKTQGWDFESCLEFVLNREGGRSANRSDRGNKNGGITQNGVTQETYDIYRKAHDLGTQSVARISPDEIRGVYKELFWNAVQCEKIRDPEMKLLLFDASVNHGTGGAVKILQRAIGGLKADGDFGPMTEAALNRVGDYERLKSRFIEERLALYERLARQDPSQRQFLNGWKNRVREIQGAIAEPAPTSRPASEELTLPKPQVTPYTVREKDSLWGIAKRELGDSKRWKEIATLNELDPKNPNLTPGQTIILPHR